MLTPVDDATAIIALSRGDKGEPGDVSLVQLNAAIDALKGGVVADGDTLAELYALIQLRATLASPTFTGVVNVPDLSLGNDSQQAANSAFVQDSIDNSIVDLIDGAGLVTLAEVEAALALKQNLDPTLTALAGLDATAGVVQQTGADTFTKLAFDTDGTLAANSDIRVATQKAVKTYADSLIAANDAMVFKGAIDCSANPNYPAASRGDTYRVSVAGKIGGASGPNVEVGDLLICLTDGTVSGTHAAVGANWTIIQANIDGAVIGPASSTSGNIATFSGTSGKLIQDGAIALSAVATLTGAQALTNKTYNGNTWTAGTGILTIAAGKTLTGSNTLTLTGTDGSSVAFGTGGTVAYQGGTLAQFASTTSAQLLGVISDETGSGALVFANTPTLIAPVLGLATATGLTLSGNQSVAAWTTNGIRLKGVSGTLTDTTSSGTVAAAYTNVLGGNTIAASSAATFTNYSSLYVQQPIAGTNVTLTNAWALGADNLRVGTSTQFSVTAAGLVSVTNATDSGASQTAGAVVITGGIGVGKNITGQTFTTRGTGAGMVLHDRATDANVATWFCPTTAYCVFYMSGAERIRINATTGDISPASDGGCDCGTASLRFANFRGVTGTIQVSDADEKNFIGEPDDAVFDAVLAVQLKLFQWKEAVARKGADKARLHYGVAAQDVRDEFKKRGLDVSRYALFCADPVMRTVDKPVQVTRHKSEKVHVLSEQIDVVDGRAVLRFVETYEDEKVFEVVPIYDADGKEIEGRTTRIPVMETVTVMVPTEEPTDQVSYALRYDQFYALRNEAIRRMIMKAAQA